MNTASPKSCGAFAVAFLLLFPCGSIAGNRLDSSSIGLHARSGDGKVGQIGVPASINANCSADVTESLNAWIAAVPDGSTIVFPRNACYRMDRQFNIAHHHDLILDGNGAVLRRMTPTPPELIPNNPANHNRAHNWHVHISDSKKITINDLRVVGLNIQSDVDGFSLRGRATFEPEKFGAAYGDKYGEAGFVITASDDVALLGIATDGTYGDGIMLGSDNVPVSHRITVKDAVIDRNGRQGVSLTSVDQAVLENVRILHSHATGFDLEPNGAKSFVRGIEIRNSYVNANTVAFSLAGANNVSDINIHDNVVRYTLPSYPWFNGAGKNTLGGVRANWRIAKNVIESPSKGILIMNAVDIEAEGNRQVGLRGWLGSAMPGIVLKAVGGRVVLKGNELLGASAVFEVEDSPSTPNVTACDNRLIDGGPYDQPSRCKP